MRTALAPDFIIDCLPDQSSYHRLDSFLFSKRAQLNFWIFGMTFFLTFGPFLTIFRSFLEQCIRSDSS